MALIGAYAAIPLAVALATYEGWSYTFLGIGLPTLVVATVLAEHARAFERVASGRDALIGLAFGLGAVVWVVAIRRLAPDNRAGVAVLIGLLIALVLGGVFYFSRFMWMWTRSLVVALMTVTPMPVAPPISKSPPSQETKAWSAESTQSDRVVVPFNRGKMAFRILGTAATFLILAQLSGGISFKPTLILYAGVILLGVIAIRRLPSRAPALSLGPDGISIRRDLCAIRHLSWARIIGFEMKSFAGNNYLVIYVKNADVLIARGKPISRWLMRKGQSSFGSPVQIPAPWLKCDANWLWEKVHAMLATSRKSHRPSENNR
jgi:hypothetical protein